MDLISVDPKSKELTDRLARVNNKFDKAISPSIHREVHIDETVMDEARYVADTRIPVVPEHNREMYIEDAKRHLAAKLSEGIYKDKHIEFTTQEDPYGPEGGGVMFAKLTILKKK